MKHVDFIIVGQGIAGSLLAWSLIKNQKTVVVIDDKSEMTASQVSAGIIHPVTGRRIVKTWMADILLPFAWDSYHEIESQFGESIFHPVKVMELLSNPKEYNDWMARSGELEFSGFIDNTDGEETYKNYLQPFYRSIIVNHSAWIDTGKLLSAFRKYYESGDMFVGEKFNFNALTLTKEGVVYGEFAASKIIFCEGYHTIRNKFWSHLPFLPSKGEILTISADMDIKHILNRKIFIAPVGKNLFRAGSTYSWDNLDNTPSLEGQEFLISQLKEILKIDFEIAGHLAAIRPTVKNRRPLLGLHPAHNQVGIFNGLGTKGCLLAPYFANHLAGYLSGKNELMKEVNVQEQGS